MNSSAAQRTGFSQQRLTGFRDCLSDLGPLLEEAALCVCATGSYGRLEAWDGSDMDLFFLAAPSPGVDFRYLPFIRVAARLVEYTERVGLPPFSGDGKYLEVLDVNEMERVLGSPEDDSTNTFTARMLLLLESQPLTDAHQYHTLIERIVGFYFHDFPGHEEDFVPIFLLNDILRFWRTLTLNYEHDRYEVRQVPAAERELAKAKSSLKNYKLKVSRLATCFSMVVHLVSEAAPVGRERVVELTAMTPQQRFGDLRGRASEADVLLDDLAEQYERFLEQVQRPNQEVLELFSDRQHRSARLREAARYGTTIYALLGLLAQDERMRHLAV